MNTANFNLLDKFIAKYRLAQVSKYISEDDVVMDFGCGAQSYLLNYHRSVIRSGVGIDYEVKNQLDGNIRLMRFRFGGEKSKLPIKNDTFDKIFMLAVLEHIQLSQLQKLITELARVLKVGGLLVMTTPTPLSKGILEFMAFKLKIISSAEIADHKKYYSKSDFTAENNHWPLALVSYKIFQFGLNSVIVMKKMKK